MLTEGHFNVTHDRERAQNNRHFISRNSPSRADIRDVQPVQRNRRAGQLLADSWPNELHADWTSSSGFCWFRLGVFLPVTSYLASLFFLSIAVFLFPLVTDGASCAV